MTAGRRPPEPPDDEVVFLDDEGGDEVARALAEAERAVAAVEERHKKHSGEHPAPVVAGSVHAGERETAVAEAARFADLEAELATQRERAIQAAEEAGKLREALLRKTADFDNLKKRTEKEKTDFFKFALAETFRELLGILDNLERALAHAPDAGTGDDFHIGIEMIARLFQDTLKKYGLTEIPAKGLPFDPTVHEAVMKEETDAATPGTILEVLQKGYVLNDRLLRPALVKVAAAPRPGGEV